MREQLIIHLSPELPRLDAPRFSIRRQVDVGRIQRPGNRFGPRVAVPGQIQVRERQRRNERDAAGAERCGTSRERGIVRFDARQILVVRNPRRPERPRRDVGAHVGRRELERVSRRVHKRPHARRDRLGVGRRAELADRRKPDVTRVRRHRPRQVLVAHARHVSARDQPIAAELSQRFEHAISRSPLRGAVGDHDRALDEVREPIGDLDPIHVLEPRPQRLALDELRHDERTAIVIAEFVDDQNVG